MPFPRKVAEGAILAQALRLVRGGGLGALSMRELAGALGVRASSLYRHYQNRDALVAALSAHAAGELELRMERSASGRPPADALRAIGWEYLRFAREEPDLFGLLVGPGEETGSETGQRIWIRILETVSAHSGKPFDSAGAIAFWSFLHGFAMLEQSGQIGRSWAQQGYLTGVESLIEGTAPRVLPAAAP